MRIAALLAIPVLLSGLAFAPPAQAEEGFSVAPRYSLGENPSSAWTLDSSVANGTGKGQEPLCFFSISTSNLERHSLRFRSAVCFPPSEYRGATGK